ncbi:MAG: MBOAT family protein, partial [Muribaculum sp.]|nr:MBOAT family protein [Muribaculum sp.]
IGFFLAVMAVLGIERLFWRSVTVRNATLLFASYFFYGYFNVGFTFILAFVTLVNFLAGNTLISRRTKHPKCIVTMATVLSLLPLIFYKYALFLCKSFVALLSLEMDFELLNGLLLPIGISFFTFQALSFTIDAYRGKITEKARLLDFALFVAFFPTILSGPIEKARQLLPQIKRYFFPTCEDFLQGFCIFSWGLFKKMVVADRLAYYVDWAYGSAQYSASGTLLIAAIFYSIQIYCDFSGYSDMALGVAKALGFNVTKNFRQPYFSRTFKEFWRKWHIALTSWFTEYVYFSLGGSRVKHKLRWVFNVSTIFLLSGIWHGAAWSFIIWGALHAVFYLVEHFLGLQKEGVRWNIFTSVISGVAVFLLVTLAWIFFRLDFESATYVICKICSGDITQFSMGASSFKFVGTVAMLGILLIYELLVRRGILSFDVENFSDKLRWNLIALVPLFILMGMFGMTSDKFVYFQF